MNLNDLLKSKGVASQHVLALRHRPYEPVLNKVLPWLAAEKPDVFNAYQQTQGEKLEKVMAGMIGSGYIASFIGHEPGKALFIGLYSIGKTKSLTQKQYWQIPAYVEMKAFGMRGFAGENGRHSVLWFDLALTGLFAAWKGKLVVGWPPPERSWWRRAHRNDIPVLSILEESVIDTAMPEWDAINLSWEQLAVLPSRWKSVLTHWRGIYYIFDTSDGKGYVGSAYGETNILGRWLNYAARGHGGNKLLKQRDPRHFRFSILQRVSPDMNATDLIRLESSWKERLHTRQPFGLNDN
ncbi:MAG: GIY-YIG nuclease family protein [Burkholderiales bacterium]|nr:GIY-YIG nuclease family protein [Burkholderiales bacterium]MCW5605619.1 GIY-YIG nuclease family protein [Burkholderiales bacterium]